MKDLVIDASVAIKWVVQEPGTEHALALRKARLAAPDLFIPECANILWKKQKLGQITPGEASMATRLLERSGVDLISTGAQLFHATALAIELDHPAYDCFYVLLARDRKCAFATADDRLIRKVQQSSRQDLVSVVITLEQAAGLI